MKNMIDIVNCIAQIVMACFTIVACFYARKAFNDQERQTGILLNDKRYNDDLKTFELFRDFIYSTFGPHTNDVTTVQHIKEISKNIDLRTYSNAAMIHINLGISVIKKILDWRDKIQDKSILECFDTFVVSTDKLGMSECFVVHIQKIFDGKNVDQKIINSISPQYNSMLHLIRKQKVKFYKLEYFWSQTN